MQPSSPPDRLLWQHMDAGGEQDWWNALVAQGCQLGSANSNQLTNMLPPSSSFCSLARHQPGPQLSGPREDSISCPMIASYNFYSLLQRERKSESSSSLLPKVNEVLLSSHWNSIPWWWGADGKSWHLTWHIADIWTRKWSLNSPVTMTLKLIDWSCHLHR